MTESHPKAVAARALPLLDLTDLSDTCTEPKIDALCRDARAGGVAAVCVWPRFVPQAAQILVNTGIRIATVSTIALVTIGFVAGHGGLGELIDQGLRAYVDYTPLTVGVVLSVALALLADGLLLVAQRLLTPWARAR